MKELRRLVVIVPAVALVVLLAVLFITRGTIEQRSFLQRGSENGASLVDQRPYQTAQTLAAMVHSAEEQRLADEAEHLADHEVDQAFAMALRQAAMQQKVLSGEGAALARKIEGLKQTLKDDQARVSQLEAAAKASGIEPVDGDDLAVAKAQMGLDSDELTDAEGDLARDSGDLGSRIQQELATREAAMKLIEGGEKKPVATAVVKGEDTLWKRGSLWFEQRSRAALIAQAQSRAEDDARGFQKQHDELGRQSDKAGSAAPPTSGKGQVKLLQALAGRSALMSILDDRVQTEQQLAAVYARWQKQVWMEHRVLGYLVLESLAGVSLLLLLTALAGVAGRTLVPRITHDARQARTLKTVVTLALEAVGLIGVLLIVFGVPEQTPTILGLATAGLTVVFQDYILSFVGWFKLMGRNGVRVGDWIEINSVGGEVAEITLFRTTLLETGNWTSRGHPTGRRVTFPNSFAIRGQYFNFSTAGQWMWDEIRLSVPATADGHELIRAIQEAVERETVKDSEQASAEWRSVTRDVGLGQFNAKPTVDLRPAASGFEVVVRFVTRASERFDLRNKIYEVMLGLREVQDKPVPADGSAEPASS